MASMHHLSGNVGTEFAVSLEALWERLQEWYLWRPEKAHPLVRSDREGSNPFPRLVYSQSSPSMVNSCIQLNCTDRGVVVCGTTFYHAGSILLLQSGLWRPTDRALEKVRVSCFHRDVWMFLDRSLTLIIQYDQIWHARELGGISTSNISQ